MFLYEGDCLKNITEIRGIRYVTVSHYSGVTAQGGYCVSETNEKEDV